MAILLLAAMGLLAFVTILFLVEESFNARKLEELKRKCADLEAEHMAAVRMLEKINQELRYMKDEHSHQL